MVSSISTAVSTGTTFRLPVRQGALEHASPITSSLEESAFMVVFVFVFVLVDLVEVGVLYKAVAVAVVVVVAVAVVVVVAVAVAAAGENKVPARFQIDSRAACAGLP
jgi:uncharacterized membrane protein